MDNINPEMAQADVCLIIGANDVVNPAARHDKSSPIFGMPIINANKAKTVLAIKRTMNPGFAGIENELYYSDNTLMVFGDAKAVVGDIVKHLSGESAARWAYRGERGRDPRLDEQLRALTHRQWVGALRGLIQMIAVSYCPYHPRNPWRTRRVRARERLRAAWRRRWLLGRQSRT